MKKTSHMLVRFSDEEAAHIRAKAKAQSISQTAVVRDSIRRDMKKAKAQP